MPPPSTPVAPRKNRPSLIPIVPARSDHEPRKKPKKPIVDAAAIYKIASKRKRAAAARQASPPKPPSSPKRRSPRRKKPRYELDQVAYQLNDSLSVTAEHLHDRTTRAIEQTHSKLLSDLAEISQKAEADKASRDSIRETLKRPFSEERLRFRDTKGDEIGTASLGKRMQHFRAKIARAENELHKNLLPRLKVLEDRTNEVWKEIGRMIGVSVKGEATDGEVMNDTKDELQDTDSIKEMRVYWEDRIRETIDGQKQKMMELENDLNEKEKRKSERIALMLSITN